MRKAISAALLFLSTFAVAVAGPAGASTCGSYVCDNGLTVTETVASFGNGSYSVGYGPGQIYPGLYEVTATSVYCTWRNGRHTTTATGDSYGWSTYGVYYWNFRDATTGQFSTGGNSPQETYMKHQGGGRWIAQLNAGEAMATQYCGRWVPSTAFTLVQPTVLDPAPPGSYVDYTNASPLASIGRSYRISTNVRINNFACYC